MSQTLNLITKGSYIIPLKITSDQNSLFYKLKT